MKGRVDLVKSKVRYSRTKRYQPRRVCNFFILTCYEESVEQACATMFR